MIITYFSEILDKFGGWLLKVLPTSPFSGFLDNFKSTFSPYLGYLNYFIPISDFVVILASFLSAYTLYLGYSIIMRWLKVIE